MVPSFSKAVLASTALLAAAAAQRPTNSTPCDYYAQKTIGGNTALDQKLLMTLVLHTALLGAYEPKYHTVKVDGLIGGLTPTTWEGQPVDLNPYFNGAFASTNTGGSSGVSANFYDDGGIEVWKQSKPSNGNAASFQNIFATHVYSYFGTFLGCSHIGTADFPAYIGKASMYEVHKFMDLNNAEMSFFVDQATRGLKSFGFDEADAQFVNTTLQTVFNKRCAPATAVIPPDAGPQLQAICIAPDCVLSVNDTCSAYEPAVAPAVANATLLGNYTKAPNGTTSLNTTTGGGSTTTPPPTKAAAGRLEATTLWTLIGAVCALVGVFAAGLV